MTNEGRTAERPARMNGHRAGPAADDRGSAEAAGSAPGPAPGSKRGRRARRVWAVGILAVVAAGAGGALASRQWWHQASAPTATITIAATATSNLVTLTACDPAHEPSRVSLCFGTGGAQAHGGVLDLVGYFGRAAGSGISGARVELLGSARQGAQLAPTGQQAITDGSGHFAFAVVASSGSMRYAFRFVGNAFYPSTASGVFAVRASK